MFKPEPGISSATSLLNGIFKRERPAGFLSLPPTSSTMISPVSFFSTQIVSSFLILAVVFYYCSKPAARLYVDAQLKWLDDFESKYRPPADATAPNMSPPPLNIPSGSKDAAAPVTDPPKLSPGSTVNRKGKVRSDVEVQNQPVEDDHQKADRVLWERICS